MSIAFGGGRRLALGLLMLVLAGAAGAGEATVVRSEVVGRGVTVGVAELMAAEAARGAEPVTALHPTKPEFEFLIERRRGLPQNPDALQGAAWPPGRTGTPAPHAPQLPGQNLLGVVSSEAGGFVPPDSHGAVGPTQVLVAANVFVRSFNKATGTADGALALSLSTFFAPVSGGAGLSDPRVKFDPVSRRWFISIITTSTNNRVLLAVSSGETITSTSSFTFFSFAASDGGGAESQTPFADYDTLGIDARGVYIGVNMFNTAGTAFLGSTVFVIRKALLLGTPATLSVAAFRQLNNGTGPGPYTPYVADNPDPAAGEAYLVGVDAASFGVLQLRRITGADTATPAISGNLTVAVPATAAPINVPVLGRSQAALDALDDRLFEAKVRNGSLWTAHNIQVNASGVASTTGGRTGSRWYQVGNLSATPTLLQSGTVFDPSATSPFSVWIPSIGITGQGHAALAASAAGAARFTDIVTAGRLAGDPLGQLGSLLTLTAASNSYTVTANRWGDYSHVATDPNDDMTMWTFQEYAPSTSTWGVRAIQLRAPPPAQPASVSPASAAQGATLNVTVNGTSSGGSGFYNPGAPFPNRITPDFGPGVTVNAVGAVTPLAATFNITVAGNAATGARSVSMTNPDGQTASAAGLFTVAAGSCPGAITVTPTTLANAALGVAYSQAFTASGGSGAITFSSAGNLPPGLSLSAAGVLAGTPTTAGSFAFAVIATDASNCTGSASLSLRVGAAQLALGARTITNNGGLMLPASCNTASIELTNVGDAPATGVSATLASSTAGVSVGGSGSTYPSIAPAGTQANATPFQISVDAGAACGTTASFTLQVNSVGGSYTLPFTLPIGADTNNYLFTSSDGNTLPAGSAPTLVAGSQTDDAVLAIPAPFAFSAYGTTVAAGAAVSVSTNGTLQLAASGGSAFSNTDLPATGGASSPFPAGAPTLMPYWDDLILTTTRAGANAGIYTWTAGAAPNRQWVIQWRGQHFTSDAAGNGETLNFGIVLNEGSNQFAFVYQTVGGVGSNALGGQATVGVQAATSGPLFTRFSFNQPLLAAGRRLAAAFPTCPSGTGVCTRPDPLFSNGFEP